MTDHELEQAKQEARAQGRREQRLTDLENDLKQHLDQCEQKAERLQNEVKELRTEVAQDRKLLYVGFGLLIAIQTAIMALSSMPGLFK